MMAFLFSSRDFNDATRRMRYLKKFRDFRKQQVDQIKITQNQLQRKIGTLNAEKAEKDELLNAQMQQTQVLKQETEQTNQVIQDLKGKENQLLREIEKNRATANRINNYIKLQIEKEMAEATRRAEEEAKRKAAEYAKANPGVAPPKPAPTPSTPSAHVSPRVKPARAEVPMLLTPTDVALASNFEGNKGKLYWPVDKGYITDHFGSHPHPVETKVMVENSGIDIQTDANASVRAVFDGVVTNKFSTIGSQAIVMIKHGNYFTVYNGLSTVNVEKGQEVKARQVIGQVANNDENVPTINFQIWKWNGKNGNVKLNPEQWIGRAH
jgi:septal ring factor EnvC (AmiA/AmiB activator)